MDRMSADEAHSLLESTYFPGAPNAAVNGGLNIALAMVILGLLIFLAVWHINGRTIIYFTLIIDILFCVSMMLGSTYTLGVEAQRRQALLRLEALLLLRAPPPPQGGESADTTSAVG